MKKIGYNYNQLNAQTMMNRRVDLYLKIIDQTNPNRLIAFN